MNTTASLTFFTFFLIIWQLIAAKGTKIHIFRWVLILVSSVAVVVINSTTVPLDNTLLKNPLFIGHIVFGAFYFIGLPIIACYGWRMLKHPTPAIREKKRVSVYLTLYAWGMSMIFALFMLFIQNPA